MKRHLIFGSCRIKEPFVDDPDALLSPLGHTHTTSDILQALEFMTGSKQFPNELKDYFRGWGYHEDKLVDISQYQTAIIEIGSIKNFYYGDIILHIGYPDQIKLNEIKELEGVKLVKEDEALMINNLNKIKGILKTNKLMLVTQQNIDFLPVRYFISYIVSNWCKNNGAIFIDPTAYIYKPKASEVFQTVDSALDTYHYKQEVFLKIREIIRSYDSI